MKVLLKISNSINYIDADDIYLQYYHKKSILTIASNNYIYCLEFQYKKDFWNKSNVYNTLKKDIEAFLGFRKFGGNYLKTKNLANDELILEIDTSYIDEDFMIEELIVKKYSFIQYERLSKTGEI